MKRIWYCKNLKKTGKPIIVKDMDTKKQYTTDSIVLRNVDIKMFFGNAKGNEKASGATTVLEVSGLGV